MIDRQPDNVKARPVKKFCDTYGVGKTTAYELLAKGILRSKKVGKRTLILEESAIAWFENLPNGGK